MTAILLALFALTLAGSFLMLREAQRNHDEAGRLLERTTHQPPAERVPHLPRPPIALWFPPALAALTGIALLAVYETASSVLLGVIIAISASATGALYERYG